MAHLAQWRGGGLAVDVNMRAGDGKRVVKADRKAGAFPMPQQIDHYGSGQAHRRGAQRPAEDGADMILELRTGAGFDGVVPGVVDAWSEFVDQDAIVRGSEKF